MLLLLLLLLSVCIDRSYSRHLNSKPMFRLNTYSDDSTKRHLLETGGWNVGSPPNMLWNTFGGAVGYDNTNNSVIIIGSANAEQSNQVQSYNIDNNEFIQLDNISRYHRFGSQTHTQIGNALYMLDRASPIAGSSYYINVYYLETKIFIPKNISIPYNAYDGCLSHINDDNDIYLIIAGTNIPIQMKTVGIYSMSEQKWLNNVPLMQIERASVSCTVFGDYFYVFGGDTLGTIQPLDSVEKLYISDLNNIANSEWLYINDTLSTGRYVTRSVIYDNLIYIIGGFRYGQQKVDVFDPKTEKITAFDSLVYGAGFTQTITIDHKIFVFGGRRWSGTDPNKWQYYDFCDLWNGYYLSMDDTPCECFEEASICREVNHCYYDNIYDFKCKNVDDEYCNTFQHDVYKPCSCFNNDTKICILFESCIWDENVCKSNGYCPIQTSSPTEIPTYHPTTTPTTYPTIYPTYNPSIYPTVNPTIEPTVYPTVNPTVYPTIDPTKSPSDPPTTFPTTNPTYNPSIYPTIYPSTDPTVYPSINPTVFPSTDPTVYPSIDPTKSPSDSPTLSPTYYAFWTLLYDQDNGIINPFSGNIITQIDLYDNMMILIDIKLNEIINNINYNILHIGNIKNEHYPSIFIKSSSDSFKIILTNINNNQIKTKPLFIEIDKIYHLNITYTQRSWIIQINDTIFYEDYSFKQHLLSQNINVYLSDPWTLSPNLQITNLKIFGYNDDDDDIVVDAKINQFSYDNINNLCIGQYGAVFILIFIIINNAVCCIALFNKQNKSKYLKIVQEQENEEEEPL